MLRITTLKSKLPPGYTYPTAPENKPRLVCSYSSINSITCFGCPGNLRLPKFCRASQTKNAKKIVNLYFKIIIMPQVSFNIPEAQVPFMMELLKKFEFVVEPFVEEDFSLTKEQIALVELERTNAKNNPDHMLNWDEVKDKLVS